jgi:hypothetical protein
MAYVELKKVFEGAEQVNYLKVMSELQSIVLVAAKKFNMVLDEEKVSDLGAMMFQTVWCLPRPIAPRIGFDHCFSRAKRYISNLISDRDILNKTVPLSTNPDEPGVTEESIESIRSKISNDCFEFEFVDAVIEHLDSLFIHSKIKSYLTTFLSKERNWIYDVSVSDYLLGRIIKACLFRNRFYATYMKNFNDVLRSHELFDEGLEFLSEREKEVLLGCILVKFNKKGLIRIVQVVLPQYILMGDLFLVMAALFGNQVLVGPTGKGMDIKTLFSDVPIYCFMEQQIKSGVSLSSAIDSGVNRFGASLNLRFSQSTKKEEYIRRCWIRIGRILKDYERFSGKCVARLARDFQLIKDRCGDTD